MAELVCIDSMVFIWGVKRQAIPEQTGFIERVNALFESLDNEGKKIILPAPILTEVLSPVSDPEDRNKFMDLVYQRFRIAPLDDLAAQKAAEIWNKTPNWKQYYKDGEDGIRNRFKYDILILGIALTHNVQCLYTEDDPLFKLSGVHGLKALKIPPIVKQTALPFSK